MKHLVILSAIFAVMKYFGHLDWQWVTVVSPILAGHGLRIARGFTWFFWAASIHLFGTQSDTDAFCLRMEKKAAKHYEKTRAVIDDIRKAMASKKRHAGLATCDISQSRSAASKKGSGELRKF